MSNLSDLEIPTELNGLSNPFDILKAWLKQAEDSGLRDPNAMVLSTSNLKGDVTSRVLLAKEITEKSLLFYTNYDSEKAKEIEQNNKVAINFFWHEIHRQIRLQGIATKTSYEKSSEYWKTRPRASQLSQLMSRQSEVVKDRSSMESRLEALENQYAEKEIPCPANWGGYEVSINKFEFWIGRQNRFHDRIVFTKVENEWRPHRLYP